MRVRWTTTTADELVHIVEHIRKDNPAAAHIPQPRAWLKSSRTTCKFCGFVTPRRIGHKHEFSKAQQPQ
jgi:hypothetical protein